MNEETITRVLFFAAGCAMIWFALDQYPSGYTVLAIIGAAFAGLALNRNI